MQGNASNHQYGTPTPTVTIGPPPPRPTPVPTQPPPTSYGPTLPYTGMPVADVAAGGLIAVTLGLAVRRHVRLRKGL